MQRKINLQPNLLLLIPHVITDKYIIENQYVNKVSIGNIEGRKSIKITFSGLTSLPYFKLISCFEHEKNAYRSTIENGYLMFEFLIPVGKEILITYGSIMSNSCKDSLSYWAA